MTIPKLDIDKVLAYHQGKDKRAPPYVIDTIGTEIIVDHLTNIYQPIGNSANSIYILD